MTLNVIIIRNLIAIIGALRQEGDSGHFFCCWLEVISTLYDAMHTKNHYTVQHQYNQ